MRATSRELRKNQSIASARMPSIFENKVCNRVLYSSDDILRICDKFIQSDVFWLMIIW